MTHEAYMTPGHTTHEAFVTPAQGERLKALGFDWHCRLYYTHEDSPEGQVWAIPHDLPVNFNDGDPLRASSPTLEQASRWLREVHGLNIEMYCSPMKKNIWWAQVVNTNKQYHRFNEAPVKVSYELALEAAIDVALRILKK